MIFKEIHEKYISTIVYNHKNTKLKPFKNKLQTIPHMLRTVIEINFLRYNPKIEDINNLDDVTELFDDAEFKSFTIDFRGKSTTFYRIMLNSEDFTEEIKKCIYKFNYLDSDIIVSVVNMNQREEEKMTDIIPLEMDYITNAIFGKDEKSQFATYILACYSYLDSVYIESDKYCLEALMNISFNMEKFYSMLLNNVDNSSFVSSLLFGEYKDGTKVDYILDYGFIDYLKQKISIKSEIDTTTEGW